MYSGFLSLLVLATAKIGLGTKDRRVVVLDNPGHYRILG